MPESRASLSDVFLLMDKAFENDRGLKIRCTSEGKATNLLYRLRAARRIDMRDAELVSGDPYSSPYNCLSFCKDKDMVEIRVSDGSHGDGITSVDPL